MMSLFSTFDMVQSKFPMFSFIMLMILVSNSSWKVSSVQSYLMFSSSNFFSFFLSLKSSGFTKMSLMFLFMLMICMVIFNFCSVLSYNFSVSSQVSVILFSSLILWLCFNMFNSINNLKGFLSHCIPDGTPIYLTWFLFLIEIISSLIRPLTLTVRLVANIVAGHLLMVLLSQLVLQVNFSVSILYIILNMVELFVALIQAYIYTTMLGLYFSELN